MPSEISEAQKDSCRVESYERPDPRAWSKCAKSVRRWARSGDLKDRAVTAVHNNVYVKFAKRDLPCSSHRRRRWPQRGRRRQLAPCVPSALSRTFNRHKLHSSIVPQ